MKVIFNPRIVQPNNIQQKQPVRQERTLMIQPEDEFLKQPSFGAGPEVDYFVKVYSDAIKNNDVKLLKNLIEENNWKFYNYCRVFDFKNEIRPLLETGRNSENQEIRDLFNDRNLSNLFSQYISSDRFVIDPGMFDYAKIYFANTQDEDKRKVIANEMVDHIFLDEAVATAEGNIFHNIFNPAHKKLSIFPMTDYERFLLRNKNERLYSKKLHELTMNARLKSIISRNGIKTPEQLLNCLNDLVMSPEILEMKYKGKELIYRISDIPVNEENKETISKIAAKLSEMKLPDNETFRTAGVRAAYNGNEEVLKSFNSVGVHYRDKIGEPISKFPQNVHEVLNNAKINDSSLTSFVKYPDVIEDYLATHPNVDINSRDNDGDTLVLKAVKERNFETLEMLAKYDDVDWNAVDKDQKNVLMQMLKFAFGELKSEYSTEFAQKLLKLLRELPRGKFDINYANYFSYGDEYCPISNNICYGCFYTASNLKDDVLAFPDFNPTMRMPGNIWTILEHASFDSDLFKKVAAHPNCPTNLVTTLGQELVLASRIADDPDLQVIKQINDIYDKNGSLDLDEIEKFINYHGKRTTNDHRFNIVNENIAHLLVDILPDMNNPVEMEKYTQLFENLHNTKFDFNAKDIFGRTPLDKAIECENEIAFNILLNYTAN